MPQAQFDVSQFLDANQLELKGASAPGVFNVVNADGKEGTFNAHEYLNKAAGLKPGSVAITANTSDSPVDISPVGFTDRVKLALGNAKGQVSYLKNKYEDVTFNGDGDLVVKNKGVWHRVDAKGLGNGNGWDTTKEFIGDVGDLADVGMQIGAQAAAGAAAGPLASGAAAAGAKAVQTSLGRIVGTYQATPQEQLLDSAIDGVITAAGVKAINGVKDSVWPAIKGGLTKIGERAAPQVKEMVASVLSNVSGTKDFNILRSINRTPQVADELNANIAIAGKNATYDAVEAAAKRRTMGTTLNVLSDAQKALSKEYVNRVDTLAEGVPDSIKTKGVPEAFNTFLSGLGEAGFVKQEQGSFVASSPKELAKLYANSGLDEPTAKVLSKTTQNFVSSIQNLKNKAESLSGGDAVKQMLELKRSLNEYYYNMIDGRPTIEKLLTPYTQQMKTSVLNSFEDASMNGPSNISAVIAGVKNIDDFYSTMKPKVSQAQDLVQSVKDGKPANFEAFVNKLYSDPSSHLNAKDLITSISDLKGPKSKEVADKIFDNVASSDFIRLAPKGSGPNGAVMQGLRLLGVGAATALGGPGAGALTAGAMSPRGALSMIKSSKAMATGFSIMKNRLSGVLPEERFKLLQNPGVFSAMLNEIMDLGNTDADANQVTQEALQR